MSDFIKPSFLESKSTDIEAYSLIDWNRVVHPEDKSAIVAMEALPGFSAVMKWVLSGVVEKFMYGQNIGDAIKLGSNQLPEYYNLLLPVCEKLGLKEVPEFYLEMNPVPNAFTCGEQKVFIKMTSGLLDNFSPEDIQVVLAHECGHIIFKHTRYTMLAQALLWGLSSTIGQLVASIGGMDILAQYVYRWMRMSEYSADRVSAIYAGNTQKTLRVIAGLAGGPDRFIKNVNFDDYLKQAEECEKVFSLEKSKFEGILQNSSLWNRTHPLNSSRANQINEFSKSSTFKNVTKTLGTYCCPICGEKMKTDNICINGHFC